jgi:hypothetical protein
MTHSSMRPMSDFDPSEPAILHDRCTNRIETWTAEQAESYRREALMQKDGSVAWRNFVFGWGHVLGG